MKIVHQNFVYEAVGKVYTEEDIKTILEESGVNSLSQLHALLEAIEDKNKKMDEEEPNPDDVPDLQATPEEKEIEDAQANQQQKSQEAPVEPVAPEGGSEVPPIETEPEIPAETPVEEPADEPSVEPAPVSMPAEKKADKEQVPEKPLPIKEPPVVPPEDKIPEKELDWSNSQTLKTLYNNYVRFFGSNNINSAGNIVGLNAPGLNEADSKFLQTDITAFVQSATDADKEPYSVWIRLRRKRTTQDFSMNSRAFIKCNCDSFSYYAGHSNILNKTFLGAVPKNKRYVDKDGVVRTINLTLPSPVNNPGNIPICCKHLSKVILELGRKGLIADFNE